ncbi:MAG: hypothetical protein D6705_04325 [Deltaproteobacteria bacterium]|nr:MAG: hypothetical protein D6705_04325 [Deltaproteobacteria bacterium]
MKNVRRWISCLAAVVAVTACRNQQRVTVPNRALDRPMDAELACVALRADGTMGAAPYFECAGASASCSNPEERQLVGFVTNSEKNEIAVFRRCDRNGLVDLDPASPGYDFLPAGAMPQELAITTDACQAVSANTQSCDLTVVDVPGAAALAFDVGEGDAPGALTYTVTPVRGDGVPLGARPGDIVAVPPELSLAGDAPIPASGAPPLSARGDREEATGGTAGTGGSGGASTGGTAGGIEPLAACDPDQPRSVYVTFPACQLIAEVSLQTGQILQSRQFVADGEGGFDVVDTGTNPSCPVECPDQVEAPAEPPPELGDPVTPTTLALVRDDLPGVDPSTYDDADEEYVGAAYDALFVGGPSGDEILEIPVDESGWAAVEDTLRLRLQDSEGVFRIRATPPMSLGLGALGSSTRQFLYVVAGDGSTRVVERDWANPFDVGIECDTQVDPSSLFSGQGVECIEVDPLAQGDPPNRRPLALGPGIRAPQGAVVTDWTFVKIRLDQVGEEGSDGSELGLANPFGRVGVVGIGVTSFGRVVHSIFGQVSGVPDTVPSRDPVGLMRVGLSAHSLWPAVDPHGDGNDAALPRVADEEPQRDIPGEDEGVAVLAPTLRRIDLAYTADGDAPVSSDQSLLAASFGNPENVDQLGSFAPVEDSGRIYENPVVRVHARDYRRWTASSWGIVWEGIIPGTTSSTGRIECDFPGWEDATCLAPPAHYVPDLGGGTCPNCEAGWFCDPELGRCVPDCETDADCSALAEASGYDLACDDVRGGCRLSDEARARAVRLVDEGASFCDDGVLAGDKVVLLGCEDDGDCGVAQACLKDPLGTRGICVAEADLAEAEADLRAACGPFLRDACGDVRLEYLITRATEEELWLQALDLPERAYLVDVELPDVDPDDAFTPATVAEQFARFSCILPDGAKQPSGGCDETSDCADIGPDYVCYEGLCRIPCEKVPEVVPGYEGVDTCRLAPLPGPRCFAEFVRYHVRLRNSFLVTGTPVGAFFPDRVHADPQTGECVEDPTVSPLLSSRIRLGRNEAETFTHPVWGIPACPSDEVEPFDPNPCRIVATRADDPATKFHTFRFRDAAEVSAIRFSNPYVSFVVDLVSLRDLGRYVPGTETVWRDDAYEPPSPDGGEVPRAFYRFYRARIPDNYREIFETVAGYAPINDPVFTGTVPMVYPVKILPAPEFGVAYAVDAGGRGGLDGIRGQVVRLFLTPPPVRGDENFRVR